jgi:hypothetical protein
MIQKSEHPGLAIYVSRNLERLEIAYLRAAASGVVDPVVLMIDLNDPRVPEIVRGTGREGIVDAHRAEARRRGLDPGVVGGMPAAEAIAFLGDAVPGLAERLEVAAALGHFRVAVVTGGEGGVIERPIPRG